MPKTARPKQAETVGDKIRERMDLLNWRPEQLSVKSGVPHSTITAIMGGRVRNPSSETLRDLAHALGVPMESLLPKAA